MPKKKTYYHRVAHLAGTSDSDEISQIGVDKADLEAVEEPPEPQESEFIQEMLIEPAGYPIKPFDAPDSLHVTVNRDPKLFQAYATEQWLGLSVQENDYIFDQLLLPDFAFKVTHIAPKEAFRIGSDTLITIHQNKVPKPRLAPVQFEDIIGNHQAKEKAEIIVEYLRDPMKFGEWAPKNILFHGPPGTGKTLMARAIATSSECAFFAKKGTTLIGLHVGDGAAKIHQLFRRARESAPAIIFIDELDSIGLNRSYQSVRGDVIEVATALLAELDGLEPNGGVITIAATNNLQLLDGGLRNRFEEEIEFPHPSEDDRAAMLQLFSRNSPIPFEADYGKLAQATAGWSGRGLHEKLMKIAVHQAIREKKTAITTSMLLALVKRTNQMESTEKPPKDIFT